MYTLIKELYVRWNQKSCYSILILGPESAGKTTFLEKVKCTYSNTYIFSTNNVIPTVGQNIGRVTVGKTKIQLWDLGGRPSLRSLWGIPILILANKQDLDGSIAIEEIKMVFNNVTEKLKECKSHIIPASAINGTGVQEAIEWLKNQMEQNTSIRKPIYY
ncbi:hypothetical protein MERGE_001046 [Pneumocystis wakefieldiae]|uniref:Small GTP-binding protein domain n=1 Tax=Pneumocystis wakefieldiae TaxID=38082 RepID=A0A899G3F2_9ASCO|nr:hypothetical protein MERGE_001046 [Pneumocystis wakefieldiae]